LYEKSRDVARKVAATAQNLRRMAKRWMQMTMIEPIRAT
jgi:hypothetical protein